MHKGRVRQRLWYKVKWKSDQGKFDLIMDEDLDKFKPFVEILSEIKTELCVAWKPKPKDRHNEQKIDEWIRSSSIPQDKSK